MRAICVALALVPQWVGCAAPPQTPLPLRPDVRQSHGYDSSNAVVIGIEHYDFMRDAQYAENDAVAVAEALTKRGFSVKRFIGSDATKAGVSEWLADDLRTSLKGNDRVLVYFAGHGVSIGQAGREMGVLMLRDSRPDKVSTGIEMDQLQRWFNTYQAKHVMFVADACYSGLALSTRSTPLPPTTPGYLQVLMANPVRFTLVAGAANQEARGRNGQGVFTRYFLNGLEGEADTTPQDGVVTGTELYAYVRSAVVHDVWENDRAEQTPQMAISGTGEFAFLPESTAGRASAVVPACSPGTVPVDGACAPSADPTGQERATKTISFELASRFATLRDPREFSQKPRARELLVSEIAGLENLLRGLRAEKSGEWFSTALRLAHTYNELALAIQANKRASKQDPNDAALEKRAQAAAIKYLKSLEEISL